MKTLRNTGFLFLLILFIFVGIFVYQAESICFQVSHSTTKNDLSQNGEIQNPVSRLFLVIEGNGFSHSLSEYHRLTAGLILANRVIPINFNFRNVTFIPALINFASPISIFIKGHALLN